MLKFVAKFISLQYELINLDKFGMAKIFLTAKDSVNIAADLYEVQQPLGWLVLIHMMPATKDSWQNLAEQFQDEGYESIAIDLRGHGSSDDGLEGYINFTDEDHQKSIFDLEAAVEYLIRNRKASPEKISFIGASIGANLALQYISEHQEYKSAVLFSAGLNYHGIAAEPLIKNLKAGQKVFFISSRDDLRSSGNNAEQNKQLYDLAPTGAQKKIKIYETGGHGTDILKNNPELASLIKDFIKES